MDEPAVRRAVRHLQAAMRGIALTIGTLVTASAAAAAPDRVDRADCDASEPWQVLAPAAPLAAGAAWIDGRRLLWPLPELAGPVRHRLLHAARGVIDVRVGEPVPRAELAITLRVATTAVERPQQLSYLGAGLVLEVPPSVSAARLRELHRQQIVLVRESSDGRVLAATAVQTPLALDDLYAPAERERRLGVTIERGHTTFRLWAPTARQVALCLYPAPGQPASRAVPMARDATTGIWRHTARGDLGGGLYRYTVDVHVRSTGWVRQRVTDPYAVSLTTDSTHAAILDLRSPALMPPGWATHRGPPRDRVRAPTDLVVYELHLRDFSMADPTVPEALRGKYASLTARDSAGLQHLRALARAGVTDVHLLPVFDFATVPEAGCVAPRIDPGPPASPQPQAQSIATKDRDCYNWGYDPLHFNAPEGSYATDARDAAVRIREFRSMVMALHEAGLRVGMDVVYNHTSASGQHRASVLDRIVPGYYQRLNAGGDVETSTCCANTATEHRMMKKLMRDSLLLWARHYRIDSFRFDLMGHQPRAAMEEAQALLRRELGRDVLFIGEGWNFGEVADHRRFRQAAQGALDGTAIGTFSDRGRDALRGGAHDDRGERLVSRRGWLHGAPEEADLVRAALAGTLRDYPLHTASGETKPLEQLDYRGQRAGYASQPGEVVNYVENHDNATLFDLNALRLPRDTSREDRARVQLLGTAITALSQGVAYFHAGVDILRSKSLDRNSYDSGDGFNRLDWSYRDNGFGAGLPPEPDNGADWPVLAPVLADERIKPTPAVIAWMRDAFRDWLAVRASTTLLRLPTAQDVIQRLRFIGTGPGSNPLCIAARIDGRGVTGAGFAGLVYAVNVSRVPVTIDDPALRDTAAYALHPALARGTDERARAAVLDSGAGRLVVPALTAVVFVAR